MEMQSKETPENLSKWHKVYVLLIAALGIYIACLYHFTQFFK